MNSKRNPADWLNGIAGTIASFAAVAIVILVVAEVALRSTIGFSFGFVEEIVSYLVVAVTFFGACFSFRKQAFFKVCFFYEMLGPRLRKLLDLAHTLIALLFCLPLFYYSIFLVISSYTRKTEAPTPLATPLYIPQLLIPAGMFVLLFFLFEFGILRLRSTELESTEQTEPKEKVQ